MGSTQPTSWTVIEAAASGDEAQRRRFVEIYEPVVSAYFHTRWRAPRQRQLAEDAVQEVFYDCFREGGALARADRSRPNRFRAYLAGVTRNTALALEARQRDGRGNGGMPSGVPSDDPSASQAFDRAWAQAILAEALDRLDAQARPGGKAAVRRVELLRLRFDEELPIREIASAWGQDAARVHHEYARARKEFLGAVKATLGEHASGPRSVSDEDVAELLSLLH